MDLLDEMAEHRFGDFEVGYHAIFHGPNGHNVPWGAPQHPLGFIADCENVGGARLNRDDRWFA
jgi:hypothetical protein